jgi:hypothetical protein
MRKKREPIDTLTDALCWISNECRKAMSKKPDRPLLAATFDERPLEVVSFPGNKDALEIAWAQRFTEALEKQSGLRYEVVGLAPEPGDVLLHRDGEPDIYLQVTEAVDLRKIKGDAIRKSYMKAIFHADPTLKTAFSGIQIALMDCGKIFEFPDPQSPEGRTLAAYTAKSILGLQSRLPDIPVCPLGGFPNPIGRVNASSDLWIDIFLTRYAAAGVVAPAQWQWFTAWVIGGDAAPHYFRAAILNKLDGNFARIRDPLWLLVYTVDCPYDIEEEADIQSLLATKRNPFDRIYTLDRARTRRIFPLIDDPETRPGPKGYCVPGAGGIPKVNDPRYRDIDETDSKHLMFDNNFLGSDSLMVGNIAINQLQLIPVSSDTK